MTSSRRSCCNILARSSFPELAKPAWLNLESNDIVKLPNKTCDLASQWACSFAMFNKLEKLPKSIVRLVNLEDTTLYGNAFTEPIPGEFLLPPLSPAPVLSLHQPPAPPPPLSTS